MERMFFVSRVCIDTGGAQTQSIQRYDDEIQAKKRWHNIIAGDIDKTTVQYELVQIVRSDGICIASEIIDNRTAPEPAQEGSNE